MPELPGAGGQQHGASTQQPAEHDASVPEVPDASVPEVPDAGGQQHDAILVAAVNGVLVAQRAAGVHDGLDAGLARQLYRVVPGEGEEGVAGEHRALQAGSSSRGSASPRVQAFADHQGPGFGTRSHLLLAALCTAIRC